MANLSRAAATPSPPRAGAKGVAPSADPNPTSTSSHIRRIATRNADEHCAWLIERYSDHERRLRSAGRGFGLVSEAAALGSLSVISTRYQAATAEVIWPPAPRVFVSHLSAGRYQTRWDGDEVRLAERGTVLFPPTAFTHVNDCSANSAVTLDLDVLLQAAEELTGIDRGQVRFTGLLPLSAMAERQWLATAAYVRQGMYSRSLEPPLLLRAAEQMVAATILTTFPNTTMTTEFRTPRDPATPATVRRAMEFIEANAAQPITLTDIAHAARVVPRTLQHAFRRHRDLAPMAYLRHVRLVRAHAELVAARPGDGTTVAAVAQHWGFAPHRFAALHRQAYGQPPSETLRS